MANEFWLSDAQWAAIDPLLPKNRPGARRVDDRRVISHRTCAGCRSLGLGVEWMGSLSRRIVEDGRDCPALAQEEPKAVAVVGGISGAQARRWQAGKKGHERGEDRPRCPGIISMASARPWPSTTAWILVVRPPRERPIACSSAPLFRPPPSDEPLL